MEREQAIATLIEKARQYGKDVFPQDPVNERWPILLALAWMETVKQQHNDAAATFTGDRALIRDRARELCRRVHNRYPGDDNENSIVGARGVPPCYVRLRDPDSTVNRDTHLEWWDRDNICVDLATLFAYGAPLWTRYWDLAAAQLHAEGRIS